MGALQTDVQYLCDEKPSAAVNRMCFGKAYQKVVKSIYNFDGASEISLPSAFLRRARTADLIEKPHFLLFPFFAVSFDC
ncbi:hypothetical protein TNCV_542541 [Trichonephila clavipes]|nr:hypothetical protein TNCV_542541 [Trichonephila clavipes]